MARRSVVTIEVDNIIDNAVARFARDTAKSGSNIYNKIVPQVNSLPEDSEGMITAVPSGGSIQSVIARAFDGAAFNTRVEALWPALTKIDVATARDFERKNGAISTSATDDAQFAIGEYRRLISDSFDGLDIDAGVVSPIMTIFNNSLGGTKSQLKDNLRDRVPEIVVNFTTFRSDNLYDQFARAISQIYADSFGLVWAKYEVVKDDRNRDFCGVRTNRYWHKNEIEAWGNMRWDGRIPSTDPTNVAELLGGYSCRHKLVWKKTSEVPEATITAWANGRTNNAGTI